MSADAETQTNNISFYENQLQLFVVVRGYNLFVRQNIYHPGVVFGVVGDIARGGTPTEVIMQGGGIAHHCTMFVSVLLLIQKHV